MTELLELQSAWDAHDVFFITYHSKRTPPARSYTFPNLTSRPWHALPVLVQAVRILARERPDWVVSNGAELAVPVFIAARMLGTRTLFIESLCRVESPSLTGRLIYPLANVFLVQWPQLVDRYGPRARYEGGLL